MLEARHLRARVPAIQLALQLGLRRLTHSSSHALSIYVEQVHFQHEHIVLLRPGSLVALYIQHHDLLEDEIEEDFGLLQLKTDLLATADWFDQTVIELSPSQQSEAIPLPLDDFLTSSTTLRHLD